MLFQRIAKKPRPLPVNFSFSLCFAQGECGVKPELLVPLAPLRENKEFKTDTPIRGYGLTPHYT